MPTTTTALAWLLLTVLAAAAAASTGASSVVVVEALQYTEQTRVDIAEWLQRLFGIQLGAEERRCAIERQLLHAPTKRCYDLYHQGPCRAWQWFVADRAAATASRGPRRLQGVCERRPCAPDYGFLAAENRCRPIDTLCPDNLHFEYNLFGEGSCQCKGFRAATGLGAPCHILFTEGGCGEGRVFVPRFNLTGAFSGQCVDNRCGDNEVLMERERMVRKCESWDIGCIPHAAGLFIAQTDLKVHLCVGGDRNVLTVPSRPGGCAFDNSGRCAKTVVQSEKPYDWFLSEDWRSMDDEEASDTDLSTAASSSSTTAYLERYLSPYALFSLVFF